MANVYFQNVTSFIVGGQYAAIVTHWFADSTDLNGNAFVDAENLNDALTTNTTGAGAGWVTLLAGLLADECYVSALRSRQQSGGAGPTAVKAFAPGDWPGLYGGQFSAFQTSGVVIWVPNLAGPLHGRSFIPGVSETALINNRFEDAYQTTLTALVDAVVIGFSETTPQWKMALRIGYPLATTYSQIQGGFLSPTPGAIKKRRIPV